jgi:hypothetical protein
MKTTRRNSKVYTLFRSLPTLPLAPFTTVAGTPMMGHVNGFGALWVTLMSVDAVGNPGALQFAGDNTDNQAVATTGAIKTVSRNYVFDGVTWDRSYSASAANLATFSGLGVSLVAPPGNWAINHTPAAATQATITRAAGAAGVRHVCTGISFTFNAVNAEAGTFLVNLRDGATGAGTILQSWRVGPFAAGASIVHSKDGLNIPGSAATAMTMEFAGAPAAGNFESVDMTGYDAPA